MWMSVIISTKQWQKELICLREFIKRKRQNIEFREKKNSAKQQKRSANIEAAREYEKKTFHKGKASNPEHIRELNRTAQNHLRKAMQRSQL